MLSRQQQKGITQGVSVYAISQLLLAAGVIFLWGRSLVSSIDRTSYKPVNPLPTVDLGDRSLTPGPTPWSIVPEDRLTPGPSPTISATQTPWVVTAVPSATPTSDPSWTIGLYVPDDVGLPDGPDRKADSKQQAKISYYYPPYAYKDPAYEINCDKIDGILECEHMANGQEVKYFIGEAVACPAEYPFGTIFEILDRYYTCRDRGGSIVRITDNMIWLDVLYPRMPNYLPWGYETEVKIWLPE